MAESEKSAAETADVGEGKAKKANPLSGLVGILGNKVTFIVSLVVVEVLVAYFVVTALIEPRLAGEPVVKQEEQHAEAELVAPHMFQLENIVVNLNGSDGMRYLAAGVAIEVDLGKDGGGGGGGHGGGDDHLKEMLPVLKHSVISVLSAKSVAEVSTSEGRELIREEIKEQADHAIDPIHVHDVFFTEFVVQ